MERANDHKNLGYEETLKRLEMYYGSGDMSDICNGDTQLFIEEQQQEITQLTNEVKDYRTRLGLRV